MKLDFIMSSLEAAAVDSFRNPHLKACIDYIRKMEPVNKPIFVVAKEGEKAEYRNTYRDALALGYERFGVVPFCVMQAVPQWELVLGKSSRLAGMISQNKQFFSRDIEF